MLRYIYFAQILIIPFRQLFCDIGPGLRLPLFILLAMIFGAVALKNGIITAAFAEPSSSSTYSTDQKASSERSIQRQKSIDVNRGKTHSKTKGSEVNKRRENSENRSTLSDRRSERNQRQEQSINVDWPQLASSIFAKIEQDKYFEGGEVAKTLRAIPVISRPCVPRGGNRTHDHAPDCRTRYGNPGIHQKYTFIYQNQGLMVALIGSYWLRAEITKIALERLLNSKSSIQIHVGKRPYNMLRNAIIDVIQNNPYLIDLATEKGRQIAAGGCKIPTDIAVTWDGVTDWNCGVLRVDPMTGSSSFAGASWTGGADVFGVKYTASILRGKTNTYVKASSVSKQVTVAKSRSSFARRQRETNGGVTISLKRNKNIGRTAAGSATAGTQTGVSVKPEK